MAKQIPVANVSWSILNDSYHSDLCIRYSAQELAIASLYLALQSLGVDVPYNSQAQTPWWQVRKLTAFEESAINGLVAVIFDFN